MTVFQLLTVTLMIKDHKTLTANTGYFEIQTSDTGSALLWPQ